MRIFVGRCPHCDGMGYKMEYSCFAGASREKICSHCFCGKIFIPCERPPMRFLFVVNPHWSGDILTWKGCDVASYGMDLQSLRDYDPRTKPVGWLSYDEHARIEAWEKANFG